MRGKPEHTARHCEERGDAAIPDMETGIELGIASAKNASQ